MYLDFAIGLVPCTYGQDAGKRSRAVIGDVSEVHVGDLSLDLVRYYIMDEVDRYMIGSKKHSDSAKTMCVQKNE